MANSREKAEIRVVPLGLLSAGHRTHQECAFGAVHLCYIGTVRNFQFDFLRSFICFFYLKRKTSDSSEITGKMLLCFPLQDQNFFFLKWERSVNFLEGH